MDVKPGGENPLNLFAEGIPKTMSLRLIKSQLPRMSAIYSLQRMMMWNDAKEKNLGNPLGLKMTHSFIGCGAPQNENFEQPFTTPKREA